MEDDNSLILKDKYIDIILKYLQSNEIIPDNIMYLFYSKTMIVVQEKAYDALTEHAKDFCLYMSNLRNSHMYLDLNKPAFVFQLGELNTCARMLDNLFEEKETEHRIVINSKLLFNKFLFFKFISENPGIKHTALAKEMGTSKSNLSQFVSRIQGYCYHYERKAGREKYYYLTKTGSQLLEQMKQNQHKIEQEKELQFLQQKYSRLVRTLYLLFSINATPSREKRLVNSLISAGSNNSYELLNDISLNKYALVENYRSLALDYITDDKIDSRLQMSKERVLLLEYIISHCILDIRSNDSLFDYELSYAVANPPQLDEQPDKEFENTAYRLPAPTVAVELVKNRNEKSDWGNNKKTNLRAYGKQYALSV